MELVKSWPFLLSLLIAIALHGFVFFDIIESSNAIFSLQKGESALTIKIISNEITPDKNKNITTPKKQKITPKKVTKSGAVSPSSAIGKISPKYPWRSRLLKEEGTVKVLTHIDQYGAPTSAKVLQTSGHRRLDGASISAVMEGKFLPASRFGNSISSVKTLTFHFKIRQR